MQNAITCPIPLLYVADQMRIRMLHATSPYTGTIASIRRLRDRQQAVKMGKMTDHQSQSPVDWAIKEVLYHYIPRVSEYLASHANSM